MGLRKILSYIFQPLFGLPGEKRELGELGGRPVRVLVEALEAHAYLAGGTRMGKSRLLRLLIEQDIDAGHGLCLIDPHGDLYEELVTYLATLPSDHPALAKTILIDPTNDDWAMGFNPLEVLPGEEIYPHVLELLTVFEKLWGDSWGARMEDLMRNSFITLAEHGLTLLEMPRLLTDPGFRSTLAEDLQSAEAKNYWKNRFGPLAARTKAEWVESTLNKVSTFVSDPWIRDMVGQTRSTINLRKWMDEGAITLVNLARGKLKRNSDLVGALVVSNIQEAALSRVNIRKRDRRPYRLIVDEFQHYATKSFEEILSEAAKYGLSIMMANQHLDQLEHTLLSSVLSNATVQIYFRCNRQDADILARQAFRATGKQIKFQLESKDLFSDEPQSNPVFIGVPEEMEGYINMLLDLSPRQALLNVRGEGGPVPFRTADAPDREAPPGLDALRNRLLSCASRPRHLVREEIERRTSPEPDEEDEPYWTK
jgi:hypothetical protein